MSAEAPSPAQLLDRLLDTPAPERARALGEGIDASTALSALIDLAGRMTLADASKADAATDVLVNLADRVGSQLDRARARRARTRTLSYAGRFREALAACDEGLRLAREAGDSIEAGRTRLASMHALGELGRLDEAIAAGEAARESFLAAGEHALAARADLNIGTAHQRRDDPSMALRCFDRARPILANDSAIGPLDNNRGEALLALNEFTAAERAFASALATFKAGNVSMAAAIAESNLADVATRQGRLQKAMHHFEQARRALEGGASPAHLARLLAEQAEVIAMLGMTEESVNEYERALSELDRLGLALEAARARAGLGTALLRLNRHAAAETALAAAAKSFDELTHDTARARVDLRRAELAGINGRPMDGRAMAMRALATLHDRPADAAAARLVLGRLALAAGRTDEAEAELTHALALARQMHVAPLVAEIMQQRASLHRAVGRLNEAISDLNAAVAEVERIRGTIQAERFRGAFLGTRSSAYEDLVTALLDRDSRDDAVAAFKAAESAKSRSLLDMMQRDLLPDSDERAVSTQDGRDAHPGSLLVRLQEARATLNGLYSVLADERRATGGDAGWRERVVATEREVDEIENRLQTTSLVAGAAAGFSPAIGVRDVAERLSADSVLLEYFIAGDEIMVFVIRGHELRLVRRVGSRAAATRLVQALQFQINRALRPGAMEGERGGRLLEDVGNVLRELAAQTLAAALAHIGDARHLVIVPHGVLHSVPFHALPLDDRPLVASRSISYAPSARMFTVLADIPDRGDLLRQPFVAGVADEQAPAIEAEARAVARTLRCEPGAVLLGKAARADHVESALPKTTLIHFACHGRYAPDSPLGSGLRLADRWLTVRDLMSMRLQARLAVLSGCETGLNLIHAGDELMGLLRGLFAAGVPSVLASLWRVDDLTTREFMAEFYGCLMTLEPGPGIIAEALRRAQMRLMEAHRHPAFWASFVLAGKP